ncbi:type B 50S ribosomal protein L31 [Wielerella bovis]|uniref:type B 50S ribosomal protein L31 n=1 Tax=Wielerella bovis TaxID=2917790 RepID=UPI002018E369|nr:type B 50S ribosomal protein L31 [Wielerella bovis]MCG7657869.1 type B 50S ribosomal protein L31 [Wielerella bovis]MCG7660091.1 type B 50S ribosomal protein L31 [Wielerella bovis]ULJ60107.1 type B 50S ribosomal protein L31 [Wielerella bovis]ULJ62309.1 type B 50S ribosomal protein L31 [Wielerella bovis]ULJ64532.1 type B 50S ribosomal protein L31 [Wielerella bovis]
MKQGIHPEDYRTILFYDSSAEQGWLIRSCANTHGKTMVWTDGQEYPVFMLDTSAASHPVYTGKQREHNKEGRASVFNQRFAGMMSAFRKDK